MYWLKAGIEALICYSGLIWTWATLLFDMSTRHSRLEEPSRTPWHRARTNEGHIYWYTNGQESSWVRPADYVSDEDELDCLKVDHAVAAVSSRSGQQDAQHSSNATTKTGVNVENLEQEAESYFTSASSRNILDTTRGGSYSTEEPPRSLSTSGAGFLTSSPFTEEVPATCVSAKQARVASSITPARKRASIHFKHALVGWAKNIKEANGVLSGTPTNGRPKTDLASLVSQGMLRVRCMLDLFSHA